MKYVFEDNLLNNKKRTVFKTIYWTQQQTHFVKLDVLLTSNNTNGMQVKALLCYADWNQY